MANVTREQEAGDTLHVATLEVAEELERTLKEQSRLQDDLGSSNDTLISATKGFSDSWAAHEATGAKLCNACRRATHEAICVEARKALHRSCEVQHKASDARRPGDTQGANKTPSTPEWKGHVNNGIGSLGRAVQTAAKATHTLTRESNEVVYVREATELVEA